jgi:NAD-dependent deacetylase
LTIDPGAIREAGRLIAAARRGVAFTGAGVSAESGHRTYRGEDGLWKEYDPVKVASIDNFLADPSAYWQVAKVRWQSYVTARPNPGHAALAAMEEARHLVAVITQNVDGLHAAAGTRRLIELHGNGTTARCLDCGGAEPRAEVQARLAEEMPPRCCRCGGIHLKPAAVFFGEALPPGAIETAYELARASDLMLVVGSSLAVFPAAYIPRQALHSGAPLVIVNAEPTPLDAEADVVIYGRSGEILPLILDAAQAPA